jgi:hypothetical protein
VSAAQQAVGDPRLSTDGERPGGDRTGTGRAWLTVARREVVVKLTDKAFIVGTVVTIALISVLLVVQGVLENRTHTYDVTVTGGQAASIGAQLHDRAHDIDDTVKVTLVGSTNDTAAPVGDRLDAHHARHRPVRTAHRRGHRGPRHGPGPQRSAGRHDGRGDAAGHDGRT